MALDVRPEDGYRKRRRLAVAALGLGIPVAYAACRLIDGWFAGAPPSPLLPLIPIAVWMAATMVSFYAFILPPSSYRCPQCRRRLPRAEDARPSYRFRCEPCGVEWDLQHSDMDYAGE